MFQKLDRSQRLIIIISISTCFFITEISIGFRTHSLALVADAFHYVELNDLIGFVVALIAVKVSEQALPPRYLAYGWQRAQLLGAFFNGVFLLALGVSILLQSFERFIVLQRVEDPVMVLIVGCIGLLLNIISASFLHEHQHAFKLMEGVGESGASSISGNHQGHRHLLISRQPTGGYELGVLGVLIHLLGDAINNVGVITSALVIWLADYQGRFYADPGVSTGIAFVILASAIPLVKNSGLILLGSLPYGVLLEDVKHDIEMLPGVSSVHELHVWRLNQDKSVASAHIVTDDSSLMSFMQRVEYITECFHAYGIHSVTLQPELAAGIANAVAPMGLGEDSPVETNASSLCYAPCGTICQPLMCCN